MSHQQYLILDYETYSEADLKTVGAYQYSVHPSTEVMCMAWRYGTREGLKTAKTHSWDPSDGPVPPALLTFFNSPNTIKVAHNAFFEQVITENVFKIPVIAEQWICTASLAAAMALPRNLEGACEALKLKTQKDMEGRRLTLKWCKPKKPSKKNLSTRHNDKAEFKRIVEYCKTDVDAEVELFLKLPPLNPTERLVWLLDQKINWTGFAVDKELVNTVLKMISEETQSLHKETKELTWGKIESVAQRDEVLQFLDDVCGVKLPDLRAKTVSDYLSTMGEDMPGRRLLEIRQAVSKSSTAKYTAFKKRTGIGDRVRDILVYHTASTGRWGGAGVQPQNFPRGTIKDTEVACEVLRKGDLELVRMIYGNPMEVFSSCLRSMIVPEIGHEFFCGDYAAIEARVLFWVARHEKGLNIYREDRDPYIEMASTIYDRPIETITSKERQLGKGAILGCGFGMGPEKFEKTCIAQGQEITPELARIAVKAYRSDHLPVTILWKNLEKAAVAAIKKPGTKYSINRTKWWVEGDFLFCELPSGRRLSYPGPTLRYKDTPWREKRPVVYHWGVNGLTRKWENASTYGGKLTENVVQAIARDVMAQAMLNLDNAGYKIILSVHDEVLSECQKGVKSLTDFEKIMSTIPPWAEGLPLKVEAWQGTRYKK